MSEPADQLAAEALKPASVSNDGVTVTRRSLKELIDYENHLAAKAATASMVDTLRGMQFKTVPPGSH